MCMYIYENPTHMHIIIDTQIQRTEEIERCVDFV